VSGDRQELLHVPSRIKHACLHGACRDPDNLSDLIDRLLMIVDEVDHFPMGDRELRQARPNDCIPIFVMTSVVAV
jgi:hypothetical protein